MKYHVSQLGRDKEGRDWKILIKDYPTGSARWLDFVPFIPISQLSETRAKKNLLPTEVAYVHLRPESQAYLNDIQVGRYQENRGLGTLLLRFIEKWLMTHGINEIFGDISRKDENQFAKLQHFYEKNEWTFELFDRANLNNESLTVGRVYKKLR